MRRWWLRWGKWTLMGFPLLAIIMTATSGDGWGTAKMPQTGAEKPVKAAAMRSESSARQAADDIRVELERLDTAALPQNREEKVGNVFVPTFWYVPPPPPPPVKPPPPPPPAVPPMPFTYLGLYEEALGKVIMLVKGDQLYTVAVGDVIENTYRIDLVERSKVEMTYLPLNIKQVISTGNPS